MTAKKKRPAEQVYKESALVTTAKAIGDAVGKIASLAGVTAEVPSPATSTGRKTSRTKNKSGLPGRQTKPRIKVSA